MRDLRDLAIHCLTCPDGFTATADFTCSCAKSLSAASKRQDISLLLHLVLSRFISVPPYYPVCGYALLQLSTDQQTVLPICESDMQMCGAYVRIAHSASTSTDNG